MQVASAEDLIAQLRRNAERDTQSARSLQECFGGVKSWGETRAFAQLGGEAGCPRFSLVPRFSESNPPQAATAGSRECQSYRLVPPGLPHKVHAISDSSIFSGVD